jgi:hypothetical protein
MSSAFLVSLALLCWLCFCIIITNTLTYAGRCPGMEGCPHCLIKVVLLGTAAAAAKADAEAATAEAAAGLARPDDRCPVLWVGINTCVL